jgi:NADH-quinone oxidoreductase subunit M
VTLGIFVLNALGIEGAILQMVNHGITTGALFLCVGAIYERTHSRQLADNTGLAGPMPRYATFLVIFTLSSLGLPGTNSFVGEFLVLVGTFFWSKWIAAVASLGIILAAAYLLWMLQRVAFGVPNAAHASHLHDLNLREMVTMAPLVVLVFWIGFYPNPLLVKMHASVNDLIEHVDVGDYESARDDNRRPEFDVQHSTLQPRTSDFASGTERRELRTSNLEPSNKDGISMRDYTAVPPIVGGRP